MWVPWCQTWTLCSTCSFSLDTANYLKRTPLEEGLQISFTCSYSVPLSWLALFSSEGIYHMCQNHLPKSYSWAIHWHSWWLVSALFTFKILLLLTPFEWTLSLFFFYFISCFSISTGLCLEQAKSFYSHEFLGPLYFYSSLPTMGEWISTYMILFI